MLQAAVWICAVQAVQQGRHLSLRVCRRKVRTQSAVYQRFAAFRKGQIIALAAVQLVACAAVQNIRIGFAVKIIRIGITVENIVTDTTIQFVIAIAAVQFVVTSVTVQFVIARITG